MKKSELQSILTEVIEVRGRFGHLPLYRVQPDWGSSGIWMPKQIGSIATGPNLIPDSFDISGRAKARLAQWCVTFEDEIPERIWRAPGSRAWFSAEGLNLAIEISVELGQTALIEYIIENSALLFRAGRCIANYPLDPTTSGLWAGTED